MNTCKTEYVLLIFLKFVFASYGIFEDCKQRTDIVFVMDTSSSMYGDFPKSKNFIKKLLLPANVDSGDVKVGVLLFASSVKIEFHLNEYSTKKTLFDRIDKIRPGHGETNTAEALRVMNEVMFRKENGDREDVQNIAVVFTDGMPTRNENLTLPRANQAKLNGIHILVIGIGDVDVQYIRGIASVPPLENAFKLKGFAQLRTFRPDYFTFCKVVDPRAECVVEPEPIANLNTTKFCRVFNVWKIRCKDIVWKITNHEFMRYESSSSTGLNCTVVDDMTVLTTLTLPEENSVFNWTAVYSPVTTVDPSGGRSSRSFSAKETLVVLVIIKFLSLIL